jgi:hypothetical protein
MSRQNKDRIRLSVTVSRETMAVIERIAQENDLPLSRAVDMAIRRLTATQKPAKPSNL